MSWILDCSIAMAWCFEDEATPRTDSLLERVEIDAAVVPLHWPLEVNNVLRTAVRRKRVTESQAAQRVSVLMSLPMRYDLLTHQLAFTTAYDLSRKHKLTSYDAAYLELSVRLGLPLATNDADLSKAASAEGVNLL